MLIYSNYSCSTILQNKIVHDRAVVDEWVSALQSCVSTNAQGGGFQSQCMFSEIDLFQFSKCMPCGLELGMCSTLEFRLHC